MNVRFELYNENITKKEFMHEIVKRISTFTGSLAALILSNLFIAIPPLRMIITVIGLILMFVSAILIYNAARLWCEYRQDCPVRGIVEFFDDSCHIQLSINKFFSKQFAGIDDYHLYYDEISSVHIYRNEVVVFYFDRNHPKSKICLSHDADPLRDDMAVIGVGKLDMALLSFLETNESFREKVAVNIRVNSYKG